VWQWAWDLEPPAAAFPKKAEELDLLADEASLEEDIVYPGQQPWLNLVSLQPLPSVALRW